MLKAYFYELIVAHISFVLQLGTVEVGKKYLDINTGHHGCHTRCCSLVEPRDRCVTSIPTTIMMELAFTISVNRIRPNARTTD